MPVMKDSARDIDADKTTLTKEQVAAKSEEQYRFGFVTDVKTVDFGAGIDAQRIADISSARNEPDFIRDFRLKAYKHWLKMKEPCWAGLNYKPIDYDAIKYYAAPQKKYESIEEVDQEILDTFDRLGVPLQEQKRVLGIAIDAVFDSVSVGTTHQAELAKHGVVFCSFTEALEKYPDLIKKYLGSVVPYKDNFFAALNSAVFTDGSFVYIPEGVHCPLDLSTYFRINAKDTGQFERTLIIAAKNSKVSYLEGCTAPVRAENQLHAAVVELIALENAEIRYSTVQNWYAGDADGKGGIYNFVTKRGLCKGKHAKISWCQVETGSAITWKYPSVILQGDDSQGEFYSVALTNGHMQADTGTKMVHLGKRTSSKIISKGISADHSRNSYRGQVKISKNADNARNFSQCDSMLVGDSSTANTFPYIEVQNDSAIVEHEATTSKLSNDQMLYLKSRGIKEEEAISLLLNGFCAKIFKELPLEFSVEAVKLLEMKLESSIG